MEIQTTPSNGDEVIVTNKDGETTDGTVQSVADDNVGAFTEDWMADGETLIDYWEDHDVSATESVINVDLGGGVYSYPESRVETPAALSKQLTESALEETRQLQAALAGGETMYPNDLNGVEKLLEEALEEHE